MIKSPLLDELREELREEHQREGSLKTMRKCVLSALETALGMEPPADIVEAVHRESNAAKLEEWLKAAIKSKSLKTFRQRASL